MTSSLIDIENVVDDKYIIVRLFERRDDGTLVNRLGFVARPLHYHSNVEQDFLVRCGAKYERVDVLGGGLVALSPESCHLKTYGQSGGFGPPDAEVLQRVFTELAPDDPWAQWTRELTITSYIRD